jgi:hypothetical protein
MKCSSRWKTWAADDAMSFLMARQIIHVDMDEFFAAVEKLDRPELCGRPLLVGGDPKGRGVVSTASYLVQFRIDRVRPLIGEGEGSGT